MKDEPQVKRELHFWHKCLGGTVYKCGWCGLNVRVPGVVSRFGGIKDSDDNFDVTCALNQDSMYEIGSKQYREIWECPVTQSKRIEINGAFEKAERMSAAAS